ncbi:MAG: nucleotidyl transferase AbiEii/AbiGii toxin family protein [Verrucomicrobiae bacterium]|nr:nucleotidyl transferase AbiEii/AbiGii toxin family protein [Verrucomicrobiae bacterium]
MNPEPRSEGDYSKRQTAAARRVLVDIGQVLADFVDCLVIVGGWTPDLLLPDADEPHVGSIDVDIVLDAAKLNDGRYAELIQLLLDTKRYRTGEKNFQLVVEVDLKDSEQPVQVEVEFLAPKDVKLKKNRPKQLADFRVLQVEAASEALHNPEELMIPGQNVRGATNTVRLRVASLADFLVMKAHAIGGRDKPKDSYDFCYCLEHFRDGMEKLAGDWKKRATEKNIAKAIGILREKFASVDAFGPQHLVEFHASSVAETQTMQARRAYELVQKFLRLL